MEKSEKIFIAGRNGLVGSAIERLFRQKGFSNIVGESSSVLDLRNQKKTEEYFQSIKPDYVILAAAKVGGIMKNMTSPAEFLYDNLQIQNNIIHFSYLYKVKKILFLASSCIYPRAAQQPMKEEYLLDGKLEPTNEGYAMAKIAGLKMCEFYNRQYGTNFISVMPCNTYGIGDNFDPIDSHVVAALIRKVYEAKVNKKGIIKIWGTGSARRELMFNEDLADACYFLFERYSGNDFYNIGTGKDISIKELVEMIMDVESYHCDVMFDEEKPDGMPRKLLDISKISKLGWRAQTSLYDGIEKTFDYYVKNVISE